ncbi:MAG: hypothetical protein AAF224_02275 [Pseudomonadota bacterium]
MAKKHLFSGGFDRRKRLLAAASCVAIAASPAVAADLVNDRDAFAPTEVASVIVVNDARTADGAAVNADDKSGFTRQWPFAAAAAVVAAALIKIIGWTGVRRGLKRAATVVGPAVTNAAGAVGKVSINAVKAVGSVFRGPIRWVIGAGVIVFAVFLGIGFYDAEWIAGVFLGATGALMGAAGVSRVRGAFACCRALVGRRNPD